MANAIDGDSTTTDGRSLRWEHRRPELLRAATEYVLEKGVTDLSLRPLGAAIGASITTLIRQFGSKDELIQEVCQEIHGQMVSAFDGFWASSEGRPLEVLRELWNLWLAPEYSRQFIFLFELYGLALRKPENYEWFAQSVVHAWIAPLEDALCAQGVDADSARELATLVVGIIRGLYLDMVATGDDDRVNRAYERSLVLLTPALEPDMD
ncbi:TetR/AcrR family transcriptional regulator [Mycolicibacterium nivoides]|uniref:TetR/AcrR family transcriptional regulator n=1 Tax=Mycolicibacterium nivoides TaxID=2487344 RepID=UPI0008B032AE|nr:TetR/AcrR family transcriptional regulator [Mycolicibacterium nivoides]SER77202.1 DNA-binding transcriptional regulator, AcrR family [Mycobacterium sp. 88mf]SFG46947.1 DNA-binding transcriptional regulator, AcrR family [Mycobacterium sp. 455mf]